MAKVIVRTRDGNIASVDNVTTIIAKGDPKHSLEFSPFDPILILEELSYTFSGNSGSISIPGKDIVTIKVE